MRWALLWLAFSLPLGCATAPAGNASSVVTQNAAPSASAVPPPPATPPMRAAGTLQKTFTGQAQPSLVVKNSMPIAQHLFVDWVERAELAPAASQSFDVTVGTHTITCADSADPDDHPAAVTEAFETGFAYAYELHPGG